MRILMSVVVLTLLIGSAVLPGWSQSNPDLQAFFRRDIALSEDQIATIRSGGRRTPFRFQMKKCNLKVR
jgi:hypothetical protein